MQLGAINIRPQPAGLILVNKIYLPKQTVRVFGLVYQIFFPADTQKRLQRPEMKSVLKSEYRKPACPHIPAFFDKQVMITERIFNTQDSFILIIVCNKRQRRRLSSWVVGKYKGIDIKQRVSTAHNPKFFCRFNIITAGLNHFPAEFEISFKVFRHKAVKRCAIHLLCPVPAEFGR